MTEKYRLLIAEDHTLMRVGLRALLAEESDVEIIGEASNGRDAMRVIAALSPPAVLMDLSMPASNGIEAPAETKRRYPDIRVLVLTLP